MQQNSDEIKKVLGKKGYNISNIICEILKRFNFKTICNRVGLIKKEGYSISEILTLMFIMPLMLLESVLAFYKSEYKNLTCMKKDVIYRLKNNEKMPWRRLLYGIVKRFKQLVTPNEKSRLSTAFILDDTPDMRVGYKIEKLSWVFNHTTNKTGYGFKNLVLGFFDGTSILPVDFALQSEKQLIRKKKEKQYRKKCIKNSNGCKRRKECRIDKVTNALNMIKRAVKNGILASYVLADSWFGIARFIKTIRAIKGGDIHVVCGIKRAKKKYSYKNRQLNLKQMIEILRKSGKPSRCRKWNTLYYEVIVDYPEIGPVKLYICRFPYQKEWRVFLSTDPDMGFSKMMEVYTIRWSIEVMFRETKQYLGLGKCKSRDFDAQITNVTICFILFIFLAYYRRITDYETIGGIFQAMKDELIEKNLVERLWIIFEELIETVLREISRSSSVDMKKFKDSREYRFMKDLFESSFLGNQIRNLDNAA
jgi:hypothetical protein